ncbi:MAG: glycoside hydrolase family 125 protein [Fimbriimonas sp.]
MKRFSRRTLLHGGIAASVGIAVDPSSILRGYVQTFPSKRPAPDARKFTSEAVEAAIRDAEAKIADRELAWLFANCFPNTLDTTVFFKETDGKPDTYVITGDIDAMWLRDSTAQVWPYLPLAKKDPKLQRMLAGVVNRQTRCIQLDPYANAFFDDPKRVSEWASDYTEMRPGVHERKWEIDSLCYAIRLAHGYWKATGDVSPFDEDWENAMDLVVQTFREQQRKKDLGPYTFKRGGDKPAPSAPEAYGQPVKPNGLICSRFRPSDDETDYQFLIPANYFAVVSLRQMATMLLEIRKEPKKAAAAKGLADEVAAALDAHGRTIHAKHGLVYAYEIDGMGNVADVVEDPNVPNLTALPYLGHGKATDKVYQATRRYLWSPDNPWFFAGKAQGLGSPHTGPDMIWPIGLTMYGLTSTSEDEVRQVLKTLKATHAGTGFMHESFHKDDPSRFSRPWFAWANTLFGEFVLHTLERYPNVLKAEL